MDFDEESEKSAFLTIISNDSIDYLVLPPDFAREHMEGKISKNPVLETGSGNWPVKFFPIKDDYYFLDGWLRFMQDNDVKKNDSLVFSLLSPSNFKVVIFGENGCIKKKKSISTPPSGKFSSLLEDEDQDDDDEDEDEDEDDEDGFEAKKKVEVEEVVIDDSGLAEENDDQQPSFFRILKKSHRFCMPFKAEFVKETGIDRYDEVQLRNEKREVWKVKIGTRFNQVYMNSPWTKFRQENKIEVGDVCEFHLVKGNLIDVIAQKKKKNDKRGRGRPPNSRKKRKFQLDSDLDY